MTSTELFLDWVDQSSHLGPKWSRSIELMLTIERNYHLGNSFVSSENEYWLDSLFPFSPWWTDMSIYQPEVKELASIITA